MNTERSSIGVERFETKEYYQGMLDVDVKGLEFQYKDYQAQGDEKYLEPVLCGLDLQVKRGEHALIFGKANAGKSTLCRILVGSIPKYLGGKIRGDIKVCGHDISAAETWDLVEYIAYLAQNSEEQLVCSTVEDEVAFPLQMLGLPRKEMVDRVDESLARVGLVQRKTQKSESLSGGEKKRLLMAVSRAVDPEILLLDESFDELDESGKESLAAWIKNTGKTVILMCSRMLDCYKGVFDSYSLMEDGLLYESSQEDLFSGQRCELGSFLPDLKQDRQVKAEDVVVQKGGVLHLKVGEFKIRKGEVVALTGPNGSGKSSFARALCGLDDVLEGRFSMDKKERLSKIGYLFQNPDYQIFLPTVRDELQYPSRKSKDIDSACELFRLKPEAVASILSFPERKRLQAAVYYLLDRDFYILDEMESALSYEDCHQMICYLRKKGAGILLITHDPMIERWANRSYTIRGGCLDENR